MEASKVIDKAIAGLTDWRGSTLAEIRRLIHEAVPDVVEEWKWMGTPVWEKDGILCLANAHKKVVKVTFSRGAALPDPKKLFNATLEGGTWRAIDFSEGDSVPAEGFKGLVRVAVAFNAAKAKGSAKTAKAGAKPKAGSKAPARKAAPKKAAR